MFDRCAFEKLVYDISKKVKSDVTVLVALGSVKQINLSGCPLTGALKVSDQWYSIDSNMAGITALCGVLGKLHEVLGENLPLVMADSRNSPSVIAATAGTQRQREEAAEDGAATATKNDSKGQTQPPPSPSGFHNSHTGMACVARHACRRYARLLRQ